MDDHDFGGYATVANRMCTDGRTISPAAFKHMDGAQVPLVWQHAHSSPDNILGHANLEYVDGDVYAKAFFNDTPSGINSKKLVQHGDIKHLSIYANRLKETAKKVVMHGNIKEVSLVMSGANPGALIDYVSFQHGDGSVEASDDEAIIHMDIPIVLAGEEPDADEDLEHAAKTYQDVYNTLDTEQTELLNFMVAQALKDKTLAQSDESDEGADEDSKIDAPEGTVIEHKEGGSMTGRNVFDQNKDKDKKDEGGNLRTLDSLTHAEVDAIFESMHEAKSWKKAFLAHVDEYGITNIELLFPDAKAMDTRPEFITRRMEWVEKVLTGTRKLPWSKIKSMSADLTLDTARAKGYVKGTMKKDQFFALSKRETSPQTIYKKQKLDRDDIIDITDFDVVAWLWIEMYFMLREESARAILVGDGREIDDEDKIFEDKIRPIAHDDEFYTDVVTVPANTNPDQLVEAVLRARTYYKGAGNPTAFMTNEVMTDMLLAKDLMGRRYYDSVENLARALRVSEIVEVPIMEDQQRNGGAILMLLLNLSDYAVGSTRGGEITKFDDFDIDFNQYKYLIEGRFSGALQKHKTAQVIIRGTGTLIVTTGIVPTFVPATGVVTIPTVTGVTYKNALTNATLSAGAQTALANGATLAVRADANTGYYFPHNFDADWAFTRPAS